MLFIVYQILKNKKNILKEYQQRYQYILVDEFQDTNYIQLQIVHLLAKGHNRICVVGDDDQSIYRFRGAYTSNIGEFKRLFPNYVEIALEENYRSTKNIINVSKKLIENNNPERSTKSLFTNNEVGDYISVIECNSDIAQIHYIINKILELTTTLDSLYKLKDISVLCRSRTSAVPLINDLKRKQIPFQFIGYSDFFTNSVIKDLISFLKIIENPVLANGEMVRTLERTCYGLKRTEVAKLSNLAYQKMCSIYESFEYINEISIDTEQFNQVKESIDYLISEKNNINIEQLVYQILYNNEFLKYETACSNTKNVTLLERFHKLTEDFAYLYPENNLSDFLSYIKYASGFEIQEEASDEEDTVKVMTIHASKGMEFPVVFIMDVVERKFPSLDKKDKFIVPLSLLKGIQSNLSEKELHIQEERRIMYVALTRAMDKLFLTYAKKYKDNLKDSKPSRFLDDIQYKENSCIQFENYESEKPEIEELDIGDQLTKITKDIVTDINNARYKNAIEKVLLFAQTKTMDIDIKGILKGLLETDFDNIKKQIINKIEYNDIIKDDHDFSVSQFNSFTRCPRIYEYKYVYRIPSLPKPYFDFGSSIHKVVEEITTISKDSQQPVDIDLAIKILQREWNPKGFTSQLEERKSFEEAKDVLKTFIEEQNKMNETIIDIEKEFSVEIEGISIKGKIDRIDKDNDDFIVIDYKTSKTASSKNKLKEDMQMIVYSLAVEHLYGKRPQKVGCWFLRANKKVMIEVSDEDIIKIKDKLISIVGSVRKGHFSPKPGWECKSCDYSLICDSAKS
jgi:DNA helicase II / ATP-dependent DNA helicase PcrA